MLPNDFEKAFDAWVEKTSPKREHELPAEHHTFIKDLLGYSGRMLSGSKRPIKTKEKEHLCVWNANLIVEGYGKVWFGDVDLTKDENNIKKIALQLKSKVYILREMDARFNNENTPQIQNAVYTTDGTTSTLGNDYSTYYEWDSKGKLYRKEL